MSANIFPLGSKSINPLHGLKEPLLSFTIHFWTANSLWFLFIGFYHKEIVGKECVKAIYSLTYTLTQYKTHVVRLSIDFLTHNETKKEKNPILREILRRCIETGKSPWISHYGVKTSLWLWADNTLPLLNKGFICDRSRKVFQRYTTGCF